MYWDKFKNDLKTIDYGNGTIKPNLWGYQSTTTKKKKRKGGYDGERRCKSVRTEEARERKDE